MSEPQQPPVPPPAQPNPAFPPAPPAPHLPATPQYPAAPQQPSAQAPQYSAAHYPDAQPYPANPQYPAQQYPATSRPGGGNTLGRTAFLIAVLTAGLSLVVSLFTPFLYLSTSGFETTSIVTGLFGVISLLGYVAALALGLIALKRPGSTLLVGIAIGIAGVSLLGLVVGFVSSTFYNLF